MTQINNSQSVPIIVSIIPDLLGGQGHVYDYHQAVGKAANLIGCKHLAAIPPDTIIKNFPPNWNTCLSSDNLEWETATIFKIFQVKSIYDWAVKLAKYLRQEVLPNSDNVVIFLERFIISHLLAIILTLWLIPTNNLSVWLLYRRDTHNQKNRIIYKILNNIIKVMLPNNRFKIITDSQLLSKSLSQYFAEPVYVMPIPHTEMIYNDNFPKENNDILCWWVGSPREEKGLSMIKSLASYISKNEHKICLLAAQSSQIKTISGGLQIQLIQDNLTRIEYLKWLATCDICLLPYNSIDYKERTSGIFVECVIAGKIPLVTDNTWMAKELCKYQLEELIIDWKQPGMVIDKILKIAQNSEIKLKLNRMQNEYKKFHSLQGYAEEINKILWKNT